VLIDGQVDRILPNIYHSENVSKKKIVVRNETHFTFSPLVVPCDDNMRFTNKTNTFKRLMYISTFSVPPTRFGDYIAIIREYNTPS
jgi:hypothetical protein